MKKTIVVQKTEESLSKSLINSVSSDYSSDSLIEFGESIVDDITGACFHSELITKIPIISMLLAFNKGVLNFRDRRYLNKILNFLSETSGASNEDKKKYLIKLDNNPDECKRAAETLLDILDKITSLEKASMVGKVFRAFMHEDEISTDNVVILSEMIEKAYLNDLISLGSTKPNEWLDDANLESVGIKQSMRAEDINLAISI